MGVTVLGPLLTVRLIPAAEVVVEQYQQDLLLQSWQDQLSLQQLVVAGHLQIWEEETDLHRLLADRGFPVLQQVVAVVVAVAAALLLKTVKRQTAAVMLHGFPAQ